MSGYTKGPWKALCFAEYASVVSSAENVAIYVNDGKRQDYTRETIDRWHADAHLIAAAPELLEALKALQAGTLCGSGADRLNLNISLEAWQALESAIAKAESL